MFEVKRYEEKGKKKGFNYTSIGSCKAEVIAYDKVGCKARRRDVCTVCGKEKTRTNVYIQEVSPDNKSEEGVPKSREYIFKESMKQAAKFASDPFICKACK